MIKKTPTVAEFLASLPDDRRAEVTTVHKATRKAVPKLAPYVTGGMGTPIIGYGKYTPVPRAWVICACHGSSAS